MLARNIQRISTAGTGRQTWWKVFTCGELPGVEPGALASFQVRAGDQRGSGQPAPFISTESASVSLELIVSGLACVIVGATVNADETGPHFIRQLTRLSCSPSESAGRNHHTDNLFCTRNAKELPSPPLRILSNHVGRKKKHTLCPHSLASLSPIRTHFLPLPGSCQRY